MRNNVNQKTAEHVAFEGGCGMGGGLAGIKPVLEFVALAATAVGLVVGVVQIYLGRHEAKRARDLEVTLTLSDDFRTRWENGWRHALNQLEKSSEGVLSAEEQDELFNMLNWVDWLGNLMACGHLSKSGAILDSIGPQIRSMLVIGSNVISADTARHGSGYWRGLHTVAKELGVSFD